MKKRDLTICYPQETHFKYNSISRLKVKGWENGKYANITQKRSGKIK